MPQTMGPGQFIDQGQQTQENLSRMGTGILQVLQFNQQKSFEAAQEKLKQLNADFKNTRPEFQNDFKVAHAAEYAAAQAMMQKASMGLLALSGRKQAEGEATKNAATEAGFAATHISTEDAMRRADSMYYGEGVSPLPPDTIGVVEKKVETPEPEVTTTAPPVKTGSDPYAALVDYNIKHTDPQKKGQEFNQLRTGETGQAGVLPTNKAAMRAYFGAELARLEQKYGQAPRGTDQLSQASTPKGTILNPGSGPGVGAAWYPVSGKPDVVDDIFDTYLGYEYDKKDLKKSDAAAVVRRIEADPTTAGPSIFNTISSVINTNEAARRSEKNRPTPQELNALIKELNKGDPEIEKRLVEKLGPDKIAFARTYQAVPWYKPQAQTTESAVQPRDPSVQPSAYLPQIQAPLQSVTPLNAQSLYGTPPAVIPPGQAARENLAERIGRRSNEQGAAFSVADTLRETPTGPAPLGQQAVANVSARLGKETPAEAVPPTGSTGIQYAARNVDKYGRTAIEDLKEGTFATADEARQDLLSQKAATGYMNALDGFTKRTHLQALDEASHDPVAREQLRELYNYRVASAPDESLAITSPDAWAARWKNHELDLEKVRLQIAMLTATSKQLKKVLTQDEIDLRDGAKYLEDKAAAIINFKGKFKKTQDFNNALATWVEGRQGVMLENRFAAAYNRRNPSDPIKGVKIEDVKLPGYAKLGRFLASIINPIQSTLPDEEDRRVISTDVERPATAGTTQKPKLSTSKASSAYSSLTGR